MEYNIAIVQQLSSLLKNMRKQSGMTQKDMGEKLGITQRRVAAIEASPESARFERILQMLSVLDADLVIRERSRETNKGSVAGEESW